jgi:enoyl-CoA hydratase
MGHLVSVVDLVAGSVEPVVVADRGAVRFVILNRPEARNALNRQMRRDFPGIIESADAYPEISAIVLTGMTPAFSAGADLKERQSAGPWPRISPNPAEVLRNARKPTIAAVNGACVTGALEMALSCSFIIAAEEARFADTHAKVGIFPAWGQLALLPRAIGVRRARQMMLTGTPIDATTAASWGLVNEVVPQGDLLDRCIDMGKAIAACDTRSVSLHMEGLSEAEGLGLNPSLAVEKRLLERWDQRQ